MVQDGKDEEREGRERSVMKMRYKYKHRMFLIGFCSLAKCEKLVRCQLVMTATYLV